MKKTIKTQFFLLQNIFIKYNWFQVIQRPKLSFFYSSSTLNKTSTVGTDYPLHLKKRCYNLRIVDFVHVKKIKKIDFPKRWWPNYYLCKQVSLDLLYKSNVDKMDSDLKNKIKEIEEGDRTHFANTWFDIEFCNKILYTFRCCF